MLTSAAGILIIFIEIAIGLVVNGSTIWFAAMLLARKIASSAGLGYAVVDPMTGSNTPVVGQILYLFLLIVFLSVRPSLGYRHDDREL